MRPTHSRRRAPGSSSTTTGAASAQRPSPRELGGAPIGAADLTSEDETDRALATRRAEELGGLDVCAAVAGVWPREDCPVWELSLERWEQHARARTCGPTFLTARGFLREVARSGHGSLVMVASTAGLFGEAGHADYAAAKSAIAQGLCSA